MFYARINKIKVFDNREGFFGLFNRAELWIYSLVSNPTNMLGEGHFIPPEKVVSFKPLASDKYRCRVCKLFRAYGLPDDCLKNHFALLKGLLYKEGWWGWMNRMEKKLKTMNSMLQIKEIHKSFGDVRVLNGVNLHLERGHVYTLKGGNGSGKTTLINIISGFLKPDGGSVAFKGKKVARFSPFRVNRLGIGRTFQDLRLAMQMTVYENILLALEKKMFAYPSLAQKKRADEILGKVSLSEKRKELAGEISYGQQKLLTIGCCMANDADLLLIDEPVAGIDKDNQLKIISLVKQLKQEGKTILQIEHNSAYIEATSDRIFQMEKGAIVC